MPTLAYKVLYNIPITLSTCLSRLRRWLGQFPGLPGRKAQENPHHIAPHSISRRIAMAQQHRRIMARDMHGSTYRRQ